MRILFTGFSPNITIKDLKKACAYLFFPWKWKTLRSGPYVETLERRLASYIGSNYAISFDSGRSALYTALSELGLGPGDEVLLQAYTCVVVVNAIRWTGASPVFVDVQNDFTMDVYDASSKISNKTKVLIIQHTFGKPARLRELLSLARTKKIKIIEDCAHALGASLEGKKLGSFGDIGIFSFGSDKVISSVRGGALTLNDSVLAAKINKRRDSLPRLPMKIVIRHLLHIPIFFAGRATYGIVGLGKYLLYFSKKMHITNRIIEDAEKRGERPLYLPSKFPNALADMLLGQFDDLEEVNRHGSMIAQIYRILIVSESVEHPQVSEGEIFLRYTIRVPNPARLVSLLRENGIVAGDWYDTVIAPRDIFITDYKNGFCPNAEVLSATTLNLPTDRSIGRADAERISAYINKYA